MKRARRRQWAEALLSGEYEQGRGQLRISSKGRHTYCCMGVLHDLAVKDGAAEWTEDGVDMGENGYLGLDAMDWAGLETDNPRIVGDIRADDANDKLHWDFTRIADALTGKLKLTDKQAYVLNRIAARDNGYMPASELRGNPGARRVCANLVRKGLLEVTDPPGWKIP